MQELERNLPASLFTREQVIYRAERRRSLSRVERWIPGCFALLYIAMLAATILR